MTVTDSPAWSSNRHDRRDPYEAPGVKCRIVSRPRFAPEIRLEKRVRIAPPGPGPAHPAVMHALGPSDEPGERDVYCAQTLRPVLSANDDDSGRKTSKASMSVLTLANLGSCRAWASGTRLGERRSGAALGQARLLAMGRPSVEAARYAICPSLVPGSYHLGARCKVNCCLRRPPGSVQPAWHTTACSAGAVNDVLEQSTKRWSHFARRCCSDICTHPSTRRESRNAKRTSPNSDAIDDT